MQLLEGDVQSTLFEPCFMIELGRCSAQEMLHEKPSGLVSYLIPEMLLVAVLKP